MNRISLRKISFHCSFDICRFLQLKLSKYFSIDWKMCVPDIFQHFSLFLCIQRLGRTLRFADSFCLFLGLLLLTRVLRPYFLWRTTSASHSPLGCPYVHFLRILSVIFLCSPRENAPFPTTCPLSIIIEFALHRLPWQVDEGVDSRQRIARTPYA